MVLAILASNLVGIIDKIWDNNRDMYCYMFNSYTCFFSLTRMRYAICSLQDALSVEEIHV